MSRRENDDFSLKPLQCGYEQEGRSNVQYDVLFKSC